MSENKTEDLLNEVIRLKQGVIALCEKFTPEITSVESTVFMETGRMPNAWVRALFHKDTSTEYLSALRQLMDFIHMDISDENSNSGEGKKQVAPKKSPRKNYLSSAAVAPSAGKANTAVSFLNTEATFILAESLFIKCVTSLVCDNTLDLNVLRKVVRSQFVDHTVSYNYQKEIVTLYDDTSVPVASCSIQGIQVTLVS